MVHGTPHDGTTSQDGGTTPHGDETMPHDAVYPYEHVHSPHGYRFLLLQKEFIHARIHPIDCTVHCQVTYCTHSHSHSQKIASA